jgi:eukaryotic-like serine/threonine-protein kinase
VLSESDFFMRKTPFQRLDDAFNRALDLDAGKRSELLKEFARTDPDLLDQLQDMLRAAEHEDDSLHDSVHRAAAAYLTLLPTHVGPFKVVRRLGVGGMGTVYLCTRSDGDFTQMLAVKRLGYAAMSSATARDRLVLERRVLGRLRHPNIAQLIDGGDDADGTPYVAMEYIEGASIRRYADSRALDLRARIKLFLSLCAAVQFAHRNSIIHRDLKPGNVLVDEHDQVKLLDFGIAKLIGDSDASVDSSMPTVAGAMTPQYASPEQIRGEIVSQASDIYSLGMMLYELLVGQRAYALETRRPSEIERIICDTTPMTPSRVAGWRGAFASDLDAIVLKALHKEPERRYASAAQLGEDLERLLVGKPVLARPDSTAYRLQTFVRRHPFGVSFSLLALLMLAGVAATMTWQAGQLAQQRDVAQREAKLATQSTNFLVEVFTASDPRLRKSNEPTVHELLDAAAKRLPNAMRSYPVTRARMMRTIGLAYAHIGDERRGIDLLRESLALSEQFAGEDSEDAADARNRLGDILRGFGHLREAESMLKRAVAWRVRNGPVDYALAESFNNLGLLQSSLGHLADAESTLRRSIALHEQANGEDAVGSAYPRHNLAIVLRKEGRLKEALATIRRAIIIKKANNFTAAEISGSQGVLAQIECDLDMLDEALRDASESLAVRRSSYGERSPMATREMAILASVRMARGEVEAARKLHEEALTIHGKAPNNDSLAAARAHLAYGDFLLATDDILQARKELQLARDTAMHFLHSGSTALEEYETALRNAEKEPH